MNMPFNSSHSLGMFLSAAVIAGSILSVGVLAHGGATGIVKERMDVMKEMGKGMKKISAMVKGEEAFDPGIVSTHAKAISKASPDIPGLFPVGSLQKASEALPIIWSEWDDFSDLSLKMADEAEKLHAATKNGDRSTITLQFAKLGKVCSGCHTDYRKKKAKKQSSSMGVPSHTQQQPRLLVSNPTLETKAPKTVDERGEYIFNMGGCASCHTTKGGKTLSGGLAMETPFGTFFTPNITPDNATGIGGWSDEEFVTAMTKGETPDGSHYYPAFPYTSYAKMARKDLLDLKSYLDRQVPVNLKNQEHDLSFPFNIRSLMTLWKFINFDDEPFQAKMEKSISWNRGAYIVNGAGHCSECHSPRNLLGGIKSDETLTGNPEGPEGEAVPGLTMEKSNRISKWSHVDILFSLQIGMTPDGDFLGGSMGHVIENSTGKLTENDLKAIVEYLRDREG